MAPGGACALGSRPAIEGRAVVVRARSGRCPARRVSPLVFWKIECERKGSQDNFYANLAEGTFRRRIRRKKDDFPTEILQVVELRMLTSPLAGLLKKGVGP